MKFLGRVMLDSARKKGWAIAGFDVFNMESARAVVNAAVQCSVPVFLQTCIESVRHMGGMGMASKILLEAKREAGIDVCVHLDHGPETSDPEELKAAIALGFESVMADGSALPLEENIALCRKVVGVAHSFGACVEGALGRVSRDLHVDRAALERLMTAPEKAAKFVEESGVDSLAVSVGTVSGFLGEQRAIVLDLERLYRIAEQVRCPLVFHGGTGIPEDQMRQAVKLGVAKINIAHGFRKVFLDGMQAHVRENPDEFDPRKALSRGAKAAETFACRKIRQITLGVVQDVP